MFCTKCGNQIKDGFKFCPKCGTPVYDEKEKVESNVKAQVEDVKEETSKKEPEAENDVKAKSKSKSTKSLKKSSESSISNDIPNSLIGKELDIEGVKKKAEQGDKNSILRQAFRYEMGIGVEKNQEKADNLYSQAGGKSLIPQFEDIQRPTIIPSDH